MPKRKRLVDDIISSNTSLVELPQDVVGEILEKLPVKSLLRFKAASKLWKREIETRRFHERHQLKSRDPSILVCYPSLEDDTKASLMTLSLGATSVSFDNHTQYPVQSTSILTRLRNTQSCDCLTCIYSETFMYVLNPATRWYRRLHEARFQALYCDTENRVSEPLLGFGKDNIKGIYKLVWLYNSDCVDLDGQTNTCEIFSFDTNNSWRYDVIVSSPHPILHHKVPAHAHGSLHWFIDAATEAQVYLSIQLFRRHTSLHFFCFSFAISISWCSSNLIQILMKETFIWTSLLSSTIVTRKGSFDLTEFNISACFATT